MTLFHYRALNDAGKEVKGTIDASSKENALDALSQLNMKPLEVTDSVAPPIVTAPKVAAKPPSPPKEVPASPPKVSPTPQPKAVPPVVKKPIVTTRDIPVAAVKAAPAAPQAEKIAPSEQPKKSAPASKPKGPSFLSRFFAWLRTRKKKPAPKVLPPLVPPATEVQASRPAATAPVVIQSPPVTKDIPNVSSASLPSKTPSAPSPVKATPQPPPAAAAPKKPVAPAKPKGPSLFARFLKWLRTPKAKKPAPVATAQPQKPAVVGASSAPHLTVVKPASASPASSATSIGSSVPHAPEQAAAQAQVQPPQTPAADVPKEQKPDAQKDVPPPNFAPRNLLQRQVPAAKIVQYSPLVSTLRLYAGWLLAWYGLVIALGYYAHVRDVPFEIPVVQGLFLSPLVFAFLLATFLFLLLSSLHHFLKGGALKGLLFAGVGIGTFWMLRKNF